MKIYDRVHNELWNDKKWEDIDNGLINVKEWSYERWYAYMTQTLKHALTSIILEMKELER